MCQTGTNGTAREKLDLVESQVLKCSNISSSILCCDHQKAGINDQWHTTVNCVNEAKARTLSMVTWASLVYVHHLKQHFFFVHIRFYMFNYAVNVILRSPKLIYNLTGTNLSPTQDWGWKVCLYCSCELTFHSCTPVPDRENRWYAAAGVTLSLSQLSIRRQQVVETLWPTLIFLQLFSVGTDCTVPF